MDKEDVEAVTTTSFNISGIPISEFKRFIEFCRLNAKTTKIFYDNGKKNFKEELCYSIAIKQLLDIASADAKNQMLYNKILKLENEMYQIKNRMVTKYV